jgi:hypothetical protein
VVTLTKPARELGFRILRFNLVNFINTPIRLTEAGCLDLTCSDVVGGLVPFWFFFFFLSTWLLPLDISLCEEGQREGDLMGEKEKG